MSSHKHAVCVRIRRAAQRGNVAADDTTTTSGDGADTAAASNDAVDGDTRQSGDDSTDACTAESDASFCARVGKACGSVTAADNCGTSRTVASCGTCSDGMSCKDNACGTESCTPESDDEFCDRLEKACGSLTAGDNCGSSRTVASCGTCAESDVCSNNACVPVCEPESDADFCSRLGKACGAVTDDDNCGSSRSVASCGTCTESDTCAENQCTSGTCVPEADADFCTRLGKNCGTTTGTDNCGSLRSVACGECDNGSQCTQANVCQAIAGIRKTWDDCNGDPSDGGETPLLYNSNNCGECNNSVDVYEHGYGWCDDGVVRFLGCDLGYKPDSTGTGCTCNSYLGGADIPDDGIDEDCNGADATNSPARGLYVDPIGGDDDAGDGSPSTPPGGMVMKVDKNGGTPVTLSSGEGGPWGIAVDASAAYWTTSDGTVKKIAK